MMRRMLLFSIVVALATTTAPLYGRSKPIGSEAALPRTTKVLFSVPVGIDGLTYGGQGSEEVTPYGPASFRIAPDGSFWITDTLRNRLLQFSSTGQRLSTLAVPDAVGLTDVATDGKAILALDGAAPQPTVYRLSFDGTIQETRVLPEEVRSLGLSGINIDAAGEPSLELRGGFASEHDGIQSATSRSPGGDEVSLRLPNLTDHTANHSIGNVLIGGKQAATIKVTNMLGGVTVLNVRPAGDFFAVVDEVVTTPTILVDRTVRHYSVEGELISAARIPLNERYTYVSHDVAFGPDDNVYAMVTRPDRIDIIRLGFRQGLKPILPEGNDPADAVTSDMMQAASCTRTRDDMINTAWSYRNNRTYLTATNLNGTCIGRSKPRYLGTVAAYYDSVPYDWAGYDTVSDFNYYMSQSYQAGDRWTCDTCYESCSRGVDCSGFVSRCWGTQRQTTRTLPDISTEINVSQAQRGDIINLAGSHVAMIESIVSNGVMTLEATEYNAYDRVVYIYNGWSRFGGYRFYRYNGVCDSTAQARPVVTGSLTLSSGGPYYVGQTLYGYFTITNRGSQSITLSRLLIGGRLNGDQSCSGGCPDFSSAYNVTLSPGQSYSYSGSRYLDRAGAYSFFVAYQKTDGSWVTNVETENGAVNTRSITVQNQQTGPPALSSYSPTPLYARSYNQTVYFYGQRLTNTTAMYVYFPNGGGAYIYPPGQITSRSYSTLQTYITLAGRGWYTFYAYTSDGGWSNGYSVWVN